ncbi:MAG: class I poly(R)-hydroxyalkanoic acid synthase [Pseudomonadota bacterium]
MNNNPGEKLLSNFFIIANKYFQVYQKLINKKIPDFHLTQDPLQLNKLYFKLFNKLFSDPDLIIKYQMSFFKSQLETIEAVCQRYYGNNPVNLDSNKKDKRFQDNFWEEHCVFAWFKEAYYTLSDWLEAIMKDLPKDDFNSIEMKRLHFVMKQFLDAISPSNFPSTNPEVLRSFFDTEGENFIKGLDNLLKDIDNSKFSLQISTTDKTKFTLGENIAVTEGKIVYQNKIIQLIHYKPLTDKNYSVPLLIVSPFINKYYVLDLHPENSLVKWLLEQGHNVFLISWINPDESLSDQSFDDYMMNGPIAALDYLSDKLNIKKIHTMGYCIGGTLLTATLAYLKSINDNRVKAASFMTTLVDFADAGDLATFVDDHSVEKIEKYMKSMGGYVDGRDMSAAFNLLRSNDMIWPYYINNYLLGKEVFPFNLLYWNSDSIRLPMALHSYYLKNMYKDNLLKEPGALIINNQAIDISKIDIPCCSVAAKDDHIVPWKNAFNSAKLFSGPINFILTQSGHVAGMVNHPSQNKYSYWTNEYNKNISPDAWFENSKNHTGSWWLSWNEWAKTHAGELIASQDPQEINPHIIEDAPGSYVKMKC